MSEIYTVNLPDIGEGVVEGEVVKWLKNEGDLVAQDEPVVVVMTDKATVELPSPEPGTLAKQYKKIGEFAELGKPLYDLSVAKAPEKKEMHEVKVAPMSAAVEESGAGLATPKTRALAKRLGVDLADIQGTGPRGRITDEDVVHHHAGRLFQKPSSSGRAHPPIESSTPLLTLEEDKREPMMGIRNAMAEKMVESKYLIPHFSFFDRADATCLIKMKEKIAPKAETIGISLTYMPLIIRALCRTLQEHPEANASIDLQTKEAVFHTHQNIGIATHSKEGLIVATLKDVHAMSLEELIRSYDALIKRAKAGELTREELTGSTVTISNFGPLGGRFATPIINYPETAILGIAKIENEPVVRGDQIVIKPILNLSWSFDHRLIDGYKAASISRTFVDAIENPAKII